jgi:hypothetical protein
MVDEYIDDFWNLIDHAGYMEGLAIVIKFRDGLQRDIQNIITQIPTGHLSDSDPKAWYKAALHCCKGNYKMCQPTPKPLHQKGAMSSSAWHLGWQYIYSWDIPWHHPLFKITCPHVPTNYILTPRITITGLTLTGMQYFTLPLMSLWSLHGLLKLCMDSTQTQTFQHGCGICHKVHIESTWSPHEVHMKSEQSVQTHWELGLYKDYNEIITLVMWQQNIATPGFESRTLYIAQNNQRT